MYAVIETGGKQYRVEVGTELEVDLLDVEPGQSITLERVLLVADGADAAVGTPVVDGAAVEARVVGASRGDKVIAFKYRPKARRRVKKGHRQDYTVLRIADIRFGGKSAAESAPQLESPAAGRKALEEAAARQAAADAALAEKLNVTSGATGTSARGSKATGPAADDGTATASTTEAAADDTTATEAAPKRRARAETAAAADAESADGDAVDAREGEAPGAASADETSEAAPRKRTRAKKDE